MWRFVRYLDAEECLHTEMATRENSEGEAT